MRPNAIVGNKQRNKQSYLVSLLLKNQASEPLYYVREEPYQRLDECEHPTLVPQIRTQPTAITRVSTKIVIHIVKTIAKRQQYLIF